MVAALDLSGLLTDLEYSSENLVVRTFGAPRVFHQILGVPSPAALLYDTRVPNSFEIAARGDPVAHALGIRFTHTSRMKILTPDWNNEGVEKEADYTVEDLKVRIEDQNGFTYSDCERNLSTPMRHLGESIREQSPV